MSGEVFWRDTPQGNLAKHIWVRNQESGIKAPPPPPGGAVAETVWTRELPAQLTRARVGSTARVYTAVCSC